MAMKKLLALAAIAGSCVLSNFKVVDDCRIGSRLAWCKHQELCMHIYTRQGDPIVIRLVVGQIKQSLGKRNFYVELVMIRQV
jgi:hypothetical protein